MKKRELVLYSGGTIGMQKTKNGYAPQQGILAEILNNMPELHDDRMPQWELVEFDPLLDSSNISVNEWNVIAKTIEKRYEEFDGFVILHGTDTMAYTASALSFMFEEIDKPIVLTGSQIPIGEPRSDAKDNIVGAIYIASQGFLSEVCIYFCGKLLRGNRTTKISADDLEAFVSPNFPPLATSGIQLKYSDNLLRPRQDHPMHLQLLENVPIGVIKVFPGIQYDLFDPIVVSKLQGLVIEAFGGGNVPGKGRGLPALIHKAFENSTVVVVCSQCPKGCSSLGTYETSWRLKQEGAVDGLDMTTEAAVTKLYYLFSCGYTRREIKTLMEQDLRGELTQIAEAKE